MRSATTTHTGVATGTRQLVPDIAEKKILFQLEALGGWLVGWSLTSVFDTNTVLWDTREALGQCISPPRHVLPVSRYQSRCLSWTGDV